jgi:hypothetical protein
MNDPKQSLKGKSFLWAFFLSLALFTCPAFWGGKVGLSMDLSLVLLAISGYIPFLLVLFTGYSFNGMWVASYSRLERPIMYWLSFTASVAIAISFSLVAYNMSTLVNKSVA